MRFIFWQKFVSSHQTAFLAALSAHHDVVLVVDYITDEHRHKMGWDFSISDQIELVIEPSDSKISELSKIADYNIISGFRDGSCVRRVILALEKNKLFFYMLLEPPMYIDKFSFQTIIRYLIYKSFFQRHKSMLRAVFAIGKSGERFYCNVFEKNKVFEFGYFIDGINKEYGLQNLKGNKYSINFAFVGSLVPKKGLLRFLKFFLKIKGLGNFKFRIFGEGSEKNSIKRLISQSKYHERFEIYGFLHNNEILSYLQQNDVLVLFNQNTEGWGVVINEGIISGNYIICTELTGASVLIEDKSELGLIMNHNINFADFEKNIINLFRSYKIDVQSNKTLTISEMISPGSAVAYFIEIINSVQQGDLEKPVAPWRKMWLLRELS